MEYQEVIRTIEKKRRFGHLSGVLISRKLLAAVGNPQKDLAFVHIAGTNGKGSTAAFLSEILKESGIKAGLFTSPHLIDFTERIQISGKKISKQRARELGAMLLNLELDVTPTMFDYCLAMALLYFKEQDCELVVLETGLGGRLDSTNAINIPLVSIITKIGYDHTAVLGETLQEIAAEKAGILKEGTRAVLESQHPEAMEILEKTCREKKILYRTIEADKILSSDLGFSYPGETDYTMRMLGEFQRENALAAVFAARELKNLGYHVTEEAIHRGIERTVWNGRMEMISKEPFLLVDGAHNPDGVAVLVKSLQSLYPNEKFRFIMGVMADKDYKKMARQIVPLAKEVMTVTLESERSLQGETLAAYISALGAAAEHKTDIKKVFAPFLTERRKTAKDRTIAFGSLYFIGEIKKIFQNSIS